MYKRKTKSRPPGPAVLTDQERYDAAQWYFYKWLSAAELAGIPKAPWRNPEPGEI